MSNLRGAEKALAELDALQIERALREAVGKPTEADWDRTRAEIQRCDEMIAYWTDRKAGLQRDLHSLELGILPTGPAARKPEWDKPKDRSGFKAMLTKKEAERAAKRAAKAGKPAGE